MNYLSPSLLSADFSCLGEQLRILDHAGVPYVHIDVMDGIFVPSISFGLPVIKSIRSCTKRIFDVHLMIEDADRYIKDFADAGADIITVHAEGCRHLDRTITTIKEQGKSPAVALNPATDLNVLEYILPCLDMVLLMSVNPGFGGQTYIEYTTDKIKDLRFMIKKKGLSVNIGVDGGINLDNLQEVQNAGANVLVAGSAIFQGNLEENAHQFLKKLK